MSDTKAEETLKFERLNIAMEVVRRDEVIAMIYPDDNDIFCDCYQGAERMTSSELRQIADYMDSLNTKETTK